MKTKKLDLKTRAIALLFLMTIIPSAYSMATTCYEAWLGAYQEATEEHFSDIAECEGTLIPFGTQLCLTEADLSYGQALDQASDEYHDCIND